MLKLIIIIIIIFLIFKLKKPIGNFTNNKKQQKEKFTTNIFGRSITYYDSNTIGDNYSIVERKQLNTEGCSQNQFKDDYGVCKDFKDPLSCTGFNKFNINTNRCESISEGEKEKMCEDNGQIYFSNECINPLTNEDCALDIDVYEYPKIPSRDKLSCVNMIDSQRENYCKDIILGNYITSTKRCLLNLNPPKILNVDPDISKMNITLDPNNTQLSNPEFISFNYNLYDSNDEVLFSSNSITVSNNQSLK